MLSCSKKSTPFLVRGSNKLIRKRFYLEHEVGGGGGDMFPLFGVVTRCMDASGSSGGTNMILSLFAFNSMIVVRA